MHLYPDSYILADSILVVMPLLTLFFVFMLLFRIRRQNKSRTRVGNAQKEYVKLQRSLRLEKDQEAVRFISETRALSTRLQAALRALREGGDTGEISRLNQELEAKQEFIRIHYPWLGRKDKAKARGNGSGGSL